MGDTGLEAVDPTTNATNGLRQSTDVGAAKSGAVDADLARLINHWPDLPATVKADIMAMIRAADSGDNPFTGEFEDAP
jgi:hypothetical protein